MMLWQVGELFREHYQLLGRLSTTNNRQAWLIGDIETKQNYVLKILYFSSPEQTWQDQKLLEREAKTLKNITHPNVPKFHESFLHETEEGDYFCLINEYIPGESFADLVVKNGSLPLAKAKEVAIAVLTILEALHSYAPPIIHRDIKPANLILREADQQICLVDFGSVQTDAAEGRTFTVVGTYGYMAPELFAGQATPASDLYSLGATLLYLLSGIEPADLPRKGSQIIIDEQIVDNFTFRKWVKRLLKPDYMERFKTATEAKQSLSQAMQETETTQWENVLSLDKKKSQFKITLDSLQVNSSNSLNIAPQSSIVTAGLSAFALTSLFLLFIVYNLSHLDSYVGSLPLPIYILSQFWPLLFLGALLRVSTRNEELVFNKNIQQYTVSWGFIFRKSYKLNGSFQVAVDQFPPDPKSQSAINDQFITLIDKRGRRFPLGRFSEEDAERLVEELKKWQEK